MRNRVACLIAAIICSTGSLVFGGRLTASADESCVQNANGSFACTYTQLHNGNFPGDSADPDCHQQCAWYLKNSHGSSMSYPYANLVNQMHAGNINFPAWMDKAVQAWSGLPYNNPIFWNCQCSSGQFLTVGNLQRTDAYGNVITSACGWGDANTAAQNGGASNDNHIVSSYATYNVSAGASWVDDTPPADGQPHCSAAQTAFHELGHATGEGHSTANQSEIMYVVNNFAGTNTDKVDGDAQALLNVLYGPYENNDSGTDSGGCHNCQMACAQVQAGTTVDLLQTINSALWTACGTSYTLPAVWGYYAKLWDVYQGVAVPSVPGGTVTPGGVLNLVAPQCSAYGNMTQWLECAAGSA